MATDIDTLEAMLRTHTRPDPQTQSQLEDMWRTLNEIFQQMKSQAMKFTSDVKMVTGDPTLDTHRAVLCVETLVEHLKSRLETISRLWNQYRQAAERQKEFEREWQKLLGNCKQVKFLFLSKTVFVFFKL